MLQPGMTPWRPGQSGNPDGVSSYAKKLRQAVEASQDAKKVVGVLEAMRKRALRGDAKAAAVYLKAVGVEMSPDSERIIRAIQVHLDGLMSEAERLEAVEGEKTSRALPPAEAP